jgi:hypothetical protein
MNTSASRWSQEWLPSVIASAPAARISSQIAAVEAPALAQARQAVGHDGTAGPAHDIAEEEETHGF